MVNNRSNRQVGGLYGMHHDPRTGMFINKTTSAPVERAAQQAEEMLFKVARHEELAAKHEELVVKHEELIAKVSRIDTDGIEEVRMKASKHDEMAKKYEALEERVSALEKLLIKAEKKSKSDQ